MYYCNKTPKMLLIGALKSLLNKVRQEFNSTVETTTPMIPHFLTKSPPRGENYILGAWTRGQANSGCQTVFCLLHDTAVSGFRMCSITEFVTSWCLFLDQRDSVKDLFGVGIRPGAGQLPGRLGQMVPGDNSTEDLDTTRHWHRREARRQTCRKITRQSTSCYHSSRWIHLATSHWKTADELDWWQVELIAPESEGGSSHLHSDTLHFRIISLWPWGGGGVLKAH